MKNRSVMNKNCTYLSYTTPGYVNRPILIQSTTSTSCSRPHTNQMGAIERIPSEIWTIIIMQPFYFPLIFDDPDSLEFVWLGQPGYWESERQRGTLRLVCHSWKDLVDKKSHRLIQMWDFVYHEMPNEVLLKAERIMFDLPRECGSWKKSHTCTDSTCRDLLWLKGAVRINDYRWSPNWRDPHKEVLSRAFHNATQENSRISNVQAICFPFSELQLSILSPPHIISLHSNLLSLELRDIRANTSIRFISLAFPRLSHLGIRKKPMEALDSDTVSIEFKNLRSFNFFVSTETLEAVAFAKWKLPSLSTLRLSEISTSARRFTAAVSSVNSILERLIVEQTSTEFLADEEFWSDFPSLKVVSWSPEVGALFSPPIEHPLHTLLYDVRFHTHYSPNAITLWLDKCPSIQIVKLYVTREWLFDAMDGVAQMLRMELLPQLRKYNKRGVQILDINGVPL